VVKVLKKKKQEKRDSTDINLLVSSASQEISEEFDKNRVIDCLEEEARIDRRIGGKIAKQVEEILIKSEAKRVTSTLVRELIDNVLLEMGLDRKLRKQNIIGIPKADIEELIFSKTLENSNIAANNPEAISFTVSETILKQYALQEVFSKEISDFHYSGAGHVHDLGFCTRLYSFDGNKNKITITGYPEEEKADLVMSLLELYDYVREEEIYDKELDAYIKYPKGLKIIDKDGRVDLQRVLKHKIAEDLLEIETEDGNKITVTKNHPCFVEENGKIIVKQAQDVEEDDIFISMG